MANSSVTVLPDKLPMNRREAALWVFLAGALMALLGLIVMVAIFANPQPPVVELGLLADFQAGAPPTPVVAGNRQLFVVNLDGELIVFDAHDTHSKIHCLIKWVPSNGRFEDPCGGSKFEIDGTWIEGPAPRGLDRYPVAIDSAGAVTVNLWNLIEGDPRP